MDFIFSPILWFLPLSTVPLIFHLINNRKFKVIKFSSVRLIDYLKTKSIRKMNIVNILLLIIRMLIIVFLILAISRPILRSASSAPKDSSSSSLVIIVDDTFSNMNSFNQEGRVKEIKDIISMVVKNYDQRVYFEVVSATKNLLYSGILENFEIEKIPIDFSNKTGNIFNITSRYFTEEYSKDFINGEMFVLSDMNEDFFQGDFHRKKWWDITIINTSNALAPPLISKMSILDEIILPSKPFQVSLDVYNPSDSKTDTIQAYLYIDDIGQSSKDFFIPAKSSKTIVFNTLIDRRGSFDIIGSLKQKGLSNKVFGNKYFLRKSVLPRLEVCFCDTGLEVSRYLKTAISAIGDSDIFSVRNCSYYYEDLLGVEIVFIDDSDLLEREGLQKYLDSGGHVALFPNFQYDQSSSLEKSDFIYISKQDVVDSKVLNHIFNNVEGDTLFKSINRDLLPIKNESIIITQEGSLWNREYINKGMIDAFAIPINVSDSDFVLKAPFIPFVHYLILSHSQQKFDQFFLGGNGDNLKNIDSQSYQIMLYDKEGELDRFESANEISLKEVDRPGNYFIISNKDTLKQFSANISDQELYSEKINSIDLIDGHSNIAIIQNRSSLESYLSKKLNDFELWHIFLSLSILLLITEFILINVFSRK